MRVPPSIIPAKRRVRRKRHGVAPVSPPPPPPPPAPDSIVSVVHDGTMAVVVETSSPVDSLGGPDALWITADGGATLIMPTNAELPDSTHVRLIFDVDVSACTAWHVEEPSMWEWLDLGPMNPPFDGGIL